MILVLSAKIVKFNLSEQVEMSFILSKYKKLMAWIARDIWHKYHSWYFKIPPNFTRLTAREIVYNNFEISLVVFMPNITTNHAISYTNFIW